MAENSSTAWRITRRVLAVLGGFVAIVILSIAVDTVLEQTVLPGLAHGEATNAVWAMVTGYRFVISIFGCWLAARLAPDRPMAHAMMLGIVGLLVSGLGVYFYQEGMGPFWYPVALVLTALPSGWIGGWLYTRGRS